MFFNDCWRRLSRHVRDDPVCALLFLVAHSVMYFSSGPLPAQHADTFINRRSSPLLVFFIIIIIIFLFLLLLLLLLLPCLFSFRLIWPRGSSSFRRGGPLSFALLLWDFALLFLPGKFEARHRLKADLLALATGKPGQKARQSDRSRVRPIPIAAKRIKSSTTKSLIRPTCAHRGIEQSGINKRHGGTDRSAPFDRPPRRLGHVMARKAGRSRPHLARS